MACILAGCLLAAGTVAGVVIAPAGDVARPGDMGPYERPPQAADGRMAGPTPSGGNRLLTTSRPPSTPASGVDDRRRSPPQGQPRVLVIPALNVRARIVPIDARQRVLVPPSDPATVGWWRGGARPGGARGAAVLTGHAVSTGGGAFDDLGRLHAGDTVRVTTSVAGLSYVVQEVESYPKQSLAAHAPSVFAQSGPPRLVLVTCEDWNGEVHLRNRVVIGRTVAR